MRARLGMVAAALVGLSMSVGPSALAHGGGGHGGGGHGGGGHAPNRPPAGGHDHRDGDRSHHPGTFSFGMSGAQVPDGGDPRGRANTTMRLDPGREIVCLRTDWRGLAGDVTAIHLHRGPAGRNGPHHIEILNDESLAGDSNRVEFCVRVTGGHHAQAEGHEGGGGAGDRIQEVVDNPAGFYLNVHSTAYPKGAVRGQLEG